MSKEDQIHYNGITYLKTKPGWTESWFNYATRKGEIRNIRSGIWVSGKPMPLKLWLVFKIKVLIAKLFFLPAK